MSQLRGCGELAVLTCVCPLPAVLPDPAVPPRGPRPAGRGRLHCCGAGGVPRPPQLCSIPARQHPAGEPRSPFPPGPPVGSSPGHPVVGREERRALPQGYKGDQGWAAAGAPRRSAHLAGHRAHAHTQARRLGWAEDTRGWEWGPSRVLGGVTPGGGPALCSPEGDSFRRAPSWAHHLTQPGLCKGRDPVCQPPDRAWPCVC